MVTNTHTAQEGHDVPASNGFIKAGSRTLPGPSIPLDKFVLEPDEVTALQNRWSVSVEELMQLLVAPASLLARAPTSDFPVGCAFALGLLLTRVQLVHWHTCRNMPLVIECVLQHWVIELKRLQDAKCLPA